MIDWKQIAATITRERESRGWSQRELGRRAGLTGAVVGFIERAERESYQAETLEAIARALELDLTLEFRKRDAQQAEIERRRAELEALLQAADPEDAAWVLRYLRREAEKRTHRTAS